VREHRELLREMGVTPERVGVILAEVENLRTGAGVRRAEQ
jgi:hypothetical protein